MKKIVIINGMGFGREVASWISEMPGHQDEFSIFGFLDNRAEAARIPGLPIIGTPENYHPKVDEILVIALSDPQKKAELARRYEEFGCSFFSVIHPTSVISAHSELGKGCIIAPFNSISSAAVIGDFVSIYGFCRIGHDVQIGSYCHIASHCSFGGNSQIPESSTVNEFTHISKKAI
jgi:UDP-3-O-[3-hydroxymyristoyl] glucosamine N-acyltransferase